jgi:hypothetical protein
MQGVRCLIPVPGTCWGRQAMSFASILVPFGSRIQVPGTCWGRRAMSFASILVPFGSRIQVPGTLWTEPGFASNAGHQVPDSGARHLLGPIQDLLAMLGVRCPIPVPGTCWGRARFASNAGRQVPDSGARQSDSSRRTTAWQRMATTWQRMATTWQRMATTWQRMATTWQRVATISQILRIGDARMVVVTPVPLRPYPPHSYQCSPLRLQPTFSDSFYHASAG